MGTRQPRSPEQIAASNIKRRRTIAATKYPLLEATDTLDDLLPKPSIELEVSRSADAKLRSSDWLEHMTAEHAEKLKLYDAYARAVIGDERTDRAIEYIRTLTDGPEYIMDKLGHEIAAELRITPLEAYCRINGVRNIWAEYEARQAAMRANMPAQALMFKEDIG